VFPYPSPSADTRFGIERPLPPARGYRVVVDRHGVHEAGLLALSKASGSDIHPVAMSPVAM
jgi:hypothetical protein